jgi:hypothetical protein
MVYSQKPWLKFYDPRINNEVTVGYDSLYDLLKQLLLSTVTNQLLHSMKDLGVTKKQEQFRNFLLRRCTGQVFKREIDLGSCCLTARIIFLAYLPFSDWEVLRFKSIQCM